jgi:ABC-type nitrate/sulfonate/bicarbonate transport system substrate-binding protein
MKLLALGFSFLVLGLLSDPQLKGSSLFALEQITVSYQGPGILTLPFAVALRQGFFQEQNLDVKLVLTKSDVDHIALATGNTDFTQRGTGTIRGAVKGLPIRMLFVGTMKPFWALVVRQEVNSVKELKGKVMGVSGLAGNHHATTRLILRQHGLDPDKDVVFKVVSIGARLPALSAGAMDGGLLEYGEAFRAKKSGFKILLNAADYFDTMSWAIGSSLKKLHDQPDQVKRFLRANVKGLKYMRENRDVALDTVMSWLKVDREMAEGIYQLSINNFTKDGTVDEVTLKLLVEQQLAEFGIKIEKLSQVMDFTLLHQVLKETR